MGIGGLELGTAHQLAHVRDGAVADLKSDPARAEAQFDYLAAQNGFLAAAAQGEVTAAVAQSAQADARLKSLHQQQYLANAEIAYKSGNAAIALGWIGYLDATNPQGSVAAAEQPLKAEVTVAYSNQLIAENRAAEAVPLLRAVVSQSSAASALYPKALLAAGKECLADDAFVDAAAYLNELTKSYPDLPQAAVAEDLLTAPQTVYGTLTDRSGNPVTERIRLSSHFTDLGGGAYGTSGPFYYGNTDDHGDFSVKRIPVGGPYVLEVFRDGDWTTLIDPSTNKPANPVQVDALTPADLAFIVLP